MTLLKQKNFWLLLVVIGAIFYFPLFYRLDALVLRIWDEARNAVSATEMLANHNFLVRFVDGKPDMWEVKPPFLIWLQAINIKILGYNELAIRLPSAIATLILLFLLVYFYFKNFKEVYTGIVIAMVLVTSQGYIGWHVSRTGDHDSLVILFMMISFLAYFKFLSSSDSKKAKNMLWLVVLTLIFGYLTKSIVSLMYLPGMFIYSLYSKNIKQLFNYRSFYLGMGLFIFIIGGYYLLREHYNYGYIKAVWYGELGPRYFNVEKKFHDKEFLFYIKNMVSGRFVPWVYICSAALFFQWFVIPKKNFPFTLYTSFTLVSFLLIISKGTNNIWYDAPAYPLMAILTGQFIYYSLLFAIQRLKLKKQLQTVFILGILISMFFMPYKRIIKNNINVTESNDDEPYLAIAYTLRDFHNNVIILPLQFDILYEGYQQHIQFYVNGLNATKEGVNIKIIDKSQILPGKDIMASMPDLCQYIEDRYIVEIILQQNSTKFYHISGYK